MCTQVVVALEWQLLLEEFAAVMSSVDSMSMTAADAKAWTLQQWAEDLFPVSAVRTFPEHALFQT